MRHEFTIKVPDGYEMPREEEFARMVEEKFCENICKEIDKIADDIMCGVPETETARELKVLLNKMTEEK